MITALLLRETLGVENQPSLNYWDKEFLKPSGSKNQLQSGKIWVESKLTCFKNTIQSLRDGDSHSKFMPSSQESKSSKKLWKDTQINWKSQREASWPINTSFLNWWRTAATWMKVNTKFSSPFTRVLSQWHLSKKPRLFTSDALQKGVMNEQKSDKELRRMRFHSNIWKRSTSSMKIGSRLTILKKSWSLIQHRISKTMKLRLLAWLCNFEISSITDFIGFFIFISFVCNKIERNYVKYAPNFRLYFKQLKIYCVQIIILLTQWLLSLMKQDTWNSFRWFLPSRFFRSLTNRYGICQSLFRIVSWLIRWKRTFRFGW